MIITPYTDLQDILTADEFKSYQFDIDRTTAVIKILEYVKMDNKNLVMYLDDDCVMRVRMILGGKGTEHDTELYRCLAVAHRSKGFDQNNNAGSMTIVNCTAYKNKTNYGFSNEYPYTLNIFNCISLKPTGGSGQNYHLATSKKGTVVQSNNTWLSGFGTSESDFESLDESLILAPRNADGTLPETLLLRLKVSAANLIDRGIEYNDFQGDAISDYVTFNGAAPDLGCYETTSGGETPTALNSCTDTARKSAPVFDLQGRRVDAFYHGVVVSKGRKYVQ